MGEVIRNCIYDFENGKPCNNFVKVEGKGF